MIDSDLDGFLAHSPATEAAIARLLADVGGELPVDYLDFLRAGNGGEGFIGDSYLRLYSTDEIPRLNREYEVATNLPGHLLFGSTTLGDILAFCPPWIEGKVAKAPFIPMVPKYAEIIANSFMDYLYSLADVPDGTRLHAVEDLKRELLGKELHDIHPIVFGGSPTDPANKRWVPVDEHVQLVRFWSDKYRRAAGNR